MLAIIQLLLSLCLVSNAVCAGSGLNTKTSIPNVTAGLTKVQNRNAINGIVLDSSHRPVQNIRIELLDDVNSLLTSTRTDSVGRFRFSGLSQGAFHVKVVTAGTNYADYVVRVELFNVRGFGAHLEQVEITLKTREESKTNKAPINPGSTFAQTVPEEARKAYEQAVQMLDGDKDTEGGMAQLQEAIKIFPEYYLALERLGAEYVKHNQFEPAREVLNKAISINSRGVLSFYALGVAQYRLREYPASIESLHQCITLAPGSQNAPHAHYFLGLALMKDGKNNDAESALKKANELGGARIPPDVHMALAQIYSNTKRYKEAADELELFLKKAPDARDAESIKNLIKQLRAKAEKR